MRPSSSTTSTPSSIVLKSVSRKSRSRASRRTTVCKPCASSRPMRPSTLSRKFGFEAMPLIDEHELVGEEQHLSVSRPSIERPQRRLRRAREICLRVPGADTRSPLECVLRRVFARDSHKIDRFPGFHCHVFDGGFRFLRTQRPARYRPLCSDYNISANAVAFLRFVRQGPGNLHDAIAGGDPAPHYGMVVVVPGIPTVGLELRWTEGRVGIKLATLPRVSCKIGKRSERFHHTGIVDFRCSVLPHGRSIGRRRWRWIDASYKVERPLN